MAMDQKPPNSKSKLLKFLPKAASVVRFQNPTNFSSPRSDNTHKLKTNCGRGFSGPIISMIPMEARRKSKNSSFEAQEPTSPKISCMGQIKHKHKQRHSNNNNNVKKTKKIVSLPKDFKTVSSQPEVKKKLSSSSTIRNIFGGVKSRRKSDHSADHHKPPAVPDRAPGLSQMRRFASSRDTFANFDWTAPQVAPVDSDHRNYYSSDEDRGESDGEEEEVVIPFSAPILVGGGGRVALEPRKEINLWKRRTMAKPRPLQVNTP
ncbi:uncharacterized protein At1g76070 [Cornus florida]|uniref:uncharacterized protein At1g76070 n=1 Tax=Cornus florida TaxID=4283 RepID=UPI00289A8937|nr:uncharacterized protein At1g76070 [Cornus florida]